MLAARRPEDAATPLVGALNAIIDCVTAQRLVATPDSSEPQARHSVRFGHLGEPVSLRAKAGGPSGLKLDVLHSFVPIEHESGQSRQAWRVVSTSYEYRVLDAGDRELLVFHWHPGSIARGPDFPHQHISAALTARTSAGGSQLYPLDKRHVPTGIVTLADVVRMLIAEFGIAERRRDWPTRLARADLIVRRSFVADADL